MTAYALDASVRRVGAGRVLIGGSPLKLMQLTEAGACLVDAVQSGTDVGHGANIDALIDRLLDAGIIHPNHHDHDPLGPSAHAVTIVVPAFAPPPGVLRSLVQTCTGAAGVIIVDDASTVPIGPVPGASVVRHPTNSGPGAARRTGLAHVQTPFVAFVDTDVTLAPDWLEGLLPHFADARVALVAPRVASVGEPGNRQGDRIGRYERVRSPLDLGPTPARVRAGTRVSYVPAAALVCRVDALRDVDGFDPTLRVGEDVDLVWRLDEAGWRVRYEPDVSVHHAPRSTLRRWVAQRYGYGRSAAPLATRHPGALAPVRVSGWSAASWAAVAGGWPVVGASIAGITTALLAGKLRNVPDGPRQAVRLGGLGHFYAGRSLASVITRAWWPLAALTSLVSRRARRAVILAALVPAALEWRANRPDLDPATYTALRILDDLSYGTGVAVGALLEGSFDSLRPDLSSWPKTAVRSPRPADR